MNKIFTIRHFFTITLCLIAITISTVSTARISENVMIEGTITTDKMDRRYFSVQDQYGQILLVPKKYLNGKPWESKKKFGLSCLKVK